MSNKVEMGEYKIVKKDGRHNYLWTPGIGDCLAIAAQHGDQVLFAHLTSQQFAAPITDPAAVAVSKFLRLCAAGDKIIGTNFRHSSILPYSAPAILLGYDLAQLRIAGVGAYVDMTLDVREFRLYHGSPETVCDQADLMGAQYGSYGGKAKKKFSGCVLF